MKFVVVSIVFLLTALGLEHGVFALMGETLGLFVWSESRLVALGVILAGCLHGGIRSLPFAMSAALLAGSAWGEGRLGATIVSFSIAVFVSGRVARTLYFDRLSIRFAGLFGLIVMESWVWSITRHVFWPETIVELQWATHAVFAALGAVLYPQLVRGIGRKAAPQVPIGRRRTDWESQGETNWDLESGTDWGFSDPQTADGLDSEFAAEDVG